MADEAAAQGMSAGARWTAALLGVALVSGTSLALGVGRPPRRENAGVAEIRRDESEGPGRSLFTRRQCVTCHTADGGGTAMGPGLGAIVPEYLADAGGDAAAARARLVAYMKDPKGVKTLRKGSTRYPNPMPPAGSLGADEAEMGAIADFVLKMTPPPAAVGGDATDR